VAQLDIRKQYADGSPLQQQDLDAFIDDIETFFNLTKLNSDNIQDDGITASTKLAAGSVTTAKLDNNSITTGTIETGAVTTAKIADGEVNTEHIALDNITTAKINDLAVTTSKIADSAVTAAKVYGSAITGAKHAAKSVVVSSSSGAISTATDTVICTVQIVSTGRPLFVGLTSDGSGNPAFIGVDQRATSAGASGLGMQLYAVVETKRTTASVDTVLNYSAVMRYSAPSYVYQSGPGFLPTYVGTLYVPPGYFWYIDAPAAGTHTYTFTLKPAYTGENAPYTSLTFGAGAFTAKAYYCAAIAYEL